VALTDTISTSSAFAARTGDEVDANQEMIGIGAANLGAGLFQGFPVSTSGSRTAVAYQAGVSGGSFALRGASGGVTRSGTINVGWTSSGTRLGDGLLDLASGTTDARADAVVIARHGANANNSVLGKITMGSGTFDALSMVIGEKTETTGTPTVSGTFVQSGGLVTSGTIRFGNITATTSAPVPVFNTTYALSSGTLQARSITTQGSVVTSQTSSAGSVRQVTWTGGTITTYDAATDLTIGGTSINAGYDMRIVLGSTSSPQVFHADAGRAITLNATAPISGSGLLTKKGAGTVTIGSTATHTGATVIDAGRLLFTGNATAATGAVSVNAGGILGGTGSLGGAITVANGGSLAPGASIGVLTSGSTVSLLNGSAFDFEINTSSTTADLLRAAAGLALTGTVDLIVTDLGGSLALPEGTTLSLVGESGCGKSTVARLVVGLYGPTRGKVFFDGQDLAVARSDAAQRKRMQMIFQDPYASLNPRWTVEAIVGEPLLEHGLITDSGQLKQRVGELLASVGLSALDMVKYPHQFSGGQRQRISIARALATAPEFLVCDEPTSALDVSVQAQVLNIMKDLQRQRGLTYLFISHNLAVVRHVSDRVGVMYLGRLVELADKHTLFSQPQHPYTRMLLDAIPKMHQTGRARTPVQGEVPNPLNPPTGCTFHPRCPQATDRCKSERPALRHIGGIQIACHHV
jgi:peptide/nickel transport system ATP-binding protein